MSWICVEREAVNQAVLQGNEQGGCCCWVLSKVAEKTSFQNCSQIGIKNNCHTIQRNTSLYIYIYKGLRINWISIFVLQIILFCLVFPVLISTSKGFPFRHQWHSIQTEKKPKQQTTPNKTKPNNRIKYIILCVTSYNMWLTYITNNCHNV